MMPGARLTAFETWESQHQHQHQHQQQTRPSNSTVDGSGLMIDLLWHDLDGEIMCGITDDLPPKPFGQVLVVLHDCDAAATLSFPPVLLTSVQKKLDSETAEIP